MIDVPRNDFFCVICFVDWWVCLWRSFQVWQKNGWVKVMLVCCLFVWSLEEIISAWPLRSPSGTLRPEGICVLLHCPLCGPHHYWNVMVLKNSLAPFYPSLLTIFTSELSTISLSTWITEVLIKMLCSWLTSTLRQGCFLEYYSFPWWINLCFRKKMVWECAPVWLLGQEHG